MTDERKLNRFYRKLDIIAKNSSELRPLLSELPNLYAILCNITADERTNWYTKMLINSALSYIVLEDDLIPDSEEGEGYMDDLFICAYVLQIIRDNISSKIILDNLPSDSSSENFFDLLFDLMYKIKSRIPLGEREKILEIVGLSSFESLGIFKKTMKDKKIRVK